MPLRESAFAVDFCGVRWRRLAADRPAVAVPPRGARPGYGVIERSARAGSEHGDIVLGAEGLCAHDGVIGQGMVGWVAGEAVRGFVGHGGRGHRVARVALAGRDAGRLAGHRGRGVPAYLCWES